MTHLLRSEWIKATSTRLMWWMGISAVLFALLSLGVPLGLGMAADDTIYMDPAFVDSLFATPSSATLFALVLGVVAMTAEFRHSTIAPTYLASPKREHVLVAKAAVLAVLGVLMGVAVVIVNTAVVFAFLASKEHSPLSWAVLAGNVAWTLVGYALFAAIGVTLGALLRGQATAIVVSVVWLLVVEGIVSVIRPEIAKWFPGQALRSLTTTPALPDSVVLPALGGVAVLVAYALAFGIAASLTTLRRDVT